MQLLYSHCGVYSYSVCVTPSIEKGGDEVDLHEKTQKVKNEGISGSLSSCIYWWEMMLLIRAGIL